jgi:hypothetical protein
VEAPSADAAAAFAALGVSTRLLDMPGFNLSKPFSKEAESADHNMGRFTIKAAVLLLSRFQEVSAGWLWLPCCKQQSWTCC